MTSLYQDKSNSMLLVDNYGNGRMICTFHTHLDGVQQITVVYVLAHTYLILISLYGIKQGVSFQRPKKKEEAKKTAARPSQL